MSAISAPSTWLQPIREGGGGRFLFFPPAGGSASSALALAGAVPEEWSVWGVQYPGRGPRLREPCAGSIREIAEACLREVLAAPCPTLLFGHSFGAFVAYDTAQLLESRGRPAAGLLVSGTSAPGSPTTELDPDGLSDAGLVAALTRQGGTSPELLADEELMELVLPALRADLSLGRRYADDHGRRLATPVAGLGGRRDRALSERELRTWRRHTDAWLGHELGEGDHFFYLQDQTLLGGVVNRHWPRELP